MWVVQSWGCETKKVKKKGREKRVRGPNPLSFLVNLVQACYVNLTFCAVLFMHAQPAISALQQEVSWRRELTIKLREEKEIG